jgi:predicted patatin/cPLA2 family phospholipase
MNKNINIFLTGGGIKGAFQGGFLYQLGKWLEHNNSNNYYNIKKIYGSSIGSVNGSIFLNNYKHLNDFWFSIKSYNSMISYWSRIPFIGRIISIIYGFFFKYSLINPKKFFDLIQKYCYHDKNDKLNVCITNITDVSNDFIEHKDVSKELMVDYIIGSSSLWLLSMPKKINNKYYADGGLYKYIPINNNIIDSAKDDINIVLSCLNNPDYSDIGSNLLFYLDKLLHITTNISYKNDIKFIQTLNNFNCYFIDKKLSNNISINNFNNDDVKKLWTCGIDYCNKFLNNLTIN